MLTKWGAALGLASAGRVVAGGGGPLGDATVWGPVADWAALGTIAGPLRVGDFAGVNDLGAVGSSGLAVYDGTDWALFQAVFPTVSDLLAFGELIATSAIAVVGTGVETDPAYQYDGAQWLRMPDGVHYIWQDRTDWADLATIADPQIDDEALVTTLGTADSSAKAQKHLNQWRLTEGNWATVADMTAWPVPGVQAVHNLAFARVKASGGSASDAVPYVYQSSNWVRYAGLTAGFAWALSSISNIDPSGVGATKAGDFGLLNGRLYRLTVPLALPGGGTQAYWVSPEVYAGSVTVGAYLIGTEVVSDAVALNLQGWPTVTRTNGSITSQTTRVRLATSAASAAVGISTLTSGITTATRVYVRYLMRSVVGNGTLDNATNARLVTFADGANGLFGVYSSAATSKGTFFWTGSGSNSAGVDQQSQAAIPGLSSADDLFEAVIDSVNNICEMYRNGVLVSTARRATGGTTDQVQIHVTSGSTATQTATLDISQVVVMTWA
jgi:hypothetical protein